VVIATLPSHKIRNTQHATQCSNANVIDCRHVHAWSRDPLLPLPAHRPLPSPKALHGRQDVSTAVGARQGGDAQRDQQKDAESSGGDAHEEHSSPAGGTCALTSYQLVRHYRIYHNIHTECK